MTTTAPTIDSPVLQLVSVSRHFRSRAETVRAVSDADLELSAGSLTALVGPSGSGKTTLINLIVGWEKPDSGEIIVSRSGGWNDLAVVPQGLGLIDDLTIIENIGLPTRLGSGGAGTVDDLMAQLGLEELGRRLPSEVSLGEQQRTALARAVIGRPRLLVADEPTAHQDEANSDRVLAILQRAAAEGSAVLVATHETRLLERVDRVVAMESGSIVETG